MERRAYQARSVGLSVEALREHRNALLIAPTGAGKTGMMAWTAGDYFETPKLSCGGRALVLQHRDELVAQNREKFEIVNPKIPTSEWTSAQKRWSTGVTFAMVQTLVRSLERMEPVDLMMIDEAHHAMAPTYLRIIDRARALNPKVAIFGVTATPNRLDKKGLGHVFTHVSDVISIGELISRGHLVAPRAFVLDVGITEGLAGVKKTKIGEYDMDAVAALVDTTGVTERIIELWREKAGDRRSVFFCATKDHAHHAADAFRAAGVRALCVTGDTPTGERRAIMRAIESGEAQCLFNVGVAIEGFDCPPIACVGLLRPSSFQSTLIQMIGRGLRPLDPTKYRGVKTDCVVLDFGRSLLEQGGIEQVCDLYSEPPAKAGVIRAMTKMCPGPADPKDDRCRKHIPVRARECPLCGFEFPRATASMSPEEMQLVELDLLIGESPFEWYRINESCYIANAFETWAISFLYGPSKTWHTFAANSDSPRRPIPVAQGTQLVCLQAGDDWMRRFGDRKAAGKRREWISKTPTERQLVQLHHLGIPHSKLNRYEASCRITAKFAKRSIVKRLEELHARLPGLALTAPEPIPQAL